MKIERFVVNPFQENTYIVSDETGEGVVIDCGAFFEEERKAIVNYIKDNNITIRHLIATHAHIDHCFGNNTIYDVFGVKPEVYKYDEYLMAKLVKQALDFCNYNLGYEMPPVGRDRIRHTSSLHYPYPRPHSWFGVLLLQGRGCCLLGRHALQHEHRQDRLREG